MRCGEGRDLGFAIKLCQGRDPIRAACERREADFPGAPRTPGLAPLSLQSQQGPGCGGQSGEQSKPLRKERRERGLPEPTVLEGGGDDFLRRRSRAGPVAGLHHQAVLGELIEVVQGVNLTVPSGVNTDNVELEVAPGAVLAVTYLVATDNPILQMFLGSLKRKRKEDTKEGWRNYRREASTHPLLGKQSKV